MNKRPHTDIHELTREEVCAHMRPFIEVTMMEHEKTRKTVDELVRVINKLKGSKVHLVIQYALISVLFIGVGILYYYIFKVLIPLII